MPRAKKTPALPDTLPTALSDGWRYEETLDQVEAIATQLESGELPLAEVLEQFAEAVSALQQCDQFLQAKQQQAALLIETLVGEDDL